MKLILALVLITMSQAARVYDCGSATSKITFPFTEYGTVYSVASDGTLSFRIQGFTNELVTTDYIQIRAYGGAPEFTTTASRRFSQFPGSYSESSPVSVVDFADFLNLPRATYKVQVDIFNANDDKLGCGFFFANQDLLVE